MRKWCNLRVGAFPLALIFIFSFVSNTLAKPDTVRDLTDDNPDRIAYYPDDVFLGNDETIYLLSSDNSSIFRWSVSQRDYTGTISLGGSPDYMTYSNDTNRIYLGYQNSVTQIRLDESSTEESFITSTRNIRGLATANEFVLVNKEYSTSGSLYHLYAPDGTITYSPSSCAYCYYVQEFVWSDANQRMYFQNYGVSPDELFWMQIDSSGVITTVQDSPYHGGEEFQNPIRVAPDGSVVLVGSGRLYDPISLSYTQSLSTTISDATWSGNSLFTLRQLEGNTQIQKWDENLSIETSRDIQGTPIRILSTSEGLVVITYYLDRPWFWLFDSELNPVFVYQPIYVSYLPLLQNPYPVFIPPGIYPVNSCVDSPVYVYGVYAGILTECVPSVEVRGNGYMQFNFTWTLDAVDGRPPVIKYSDAYNPNMFVSDNEANHYDHVEVGGAAAETITLVDGVPVEGWFLFIPAKQGATTFAFHDDDQGVVIDEIVLLP